MHSSDSMARRPALQRLCGISHMLAAVAVVLLATGNLAACRPESANGNFRRIPLQLPSTYPAPEVLESTAPHTATVFLFHGLGGSPKDLDFLGPTLAGRLPFVKWVSGQAPRRYVTVSNEEENAWFDVRALGSLELASNEDVQGLDQSLSYVESLIAEEVAAGIPSTRIVIGGFSQGAALSLLSLRAPPQLAGMFSLAGYLPLANASVLVSPANLGLPVLMCQGEEDSTVPLELAQISESALQEAGANVTFSLFEGGHGFGSAEISAVEGFISQQLAPVPVNTQVVAG